MLSVITLTCIMYDIRYVILYSRHATTPLETYFYLQTTIHLYAIAGSTFAHGFFCIIFSARLINERMDDVRVPDYALVSVGINIYLEILIVYSKFTHASVLCIIFKSYNYKFRMRGNDTLVEIMFLDFTLQIGNYFEEETNAHSYECRLRSS